MTREKKGIEHSTIYIYIYVYIYIYFFLFGIFVRKRMKSKVTLFGSIIRKNLSESIYDNYHYDLK